MALKKVWLAVVLLSLCSCSTRVGDLTIISPNNVNLKKINLDELPQRRNVVGKDVKPVVLVFPLGQPTIEEAVSDALRKGGGDLMTDVSIYVTGWWGVLFGQQGIEVRGNVVNSRGGRDD